VLRVARPLSKLVGLVHPKSQLDHDNQECHEKRLKLGGKDKGKENAQRMGSMTEDPTEVARRVLENAPRAKTVGEPQGQGRARPYPILLGPVVA